MQLTQEQNEIIHSDGNIKINAVAGSGKTTTIIEYARARPRHAKILYLAFNRSVRTEAAKKFAEKKLTNIKVETAHSLAYKHVVFNSPYKVRASGYKTYEIAGLLRLKGSGGPHTEYIVAHHINKFVTYFCNCEKQKVQDLNYLDVVSDPKAKAFVETLYEYIEKQTRALLNKMDKGEIEITHDFYLKKFQLAEPKLHYDYILFDEGQDASPAMLDVFLKQSAVKVIVGDTHQQIYGWRHAVNSLEKTDFKTLQLSASFRFGPEIARLARQILEWKNHLYEFSPPVITGKGRHQEHRSRAVLARTHLALLLKAINYVTATPSSRVYFEGNFNSYAYADEGASLYDVLNLYEGRRFLIKDKIIQAMRDPDELEDYIEKTEDVQLGMMVEIVKQYGSRIPGIIRSIKERHVEEGEKGRADMIFSTVHRCKGMEYDTVQLANDFITESKLENLKKETMEESGLSKWIEEINLLYVAVTRVKHTLCIPETLLPTLFQKSAHVRVLLPDKIEEKNFSSSDTTPSAAAFRKQFKAAYQPWSRELDGELENLYRQGRNIRDMASYFGRTNGAIRSRLKKLGLG